MTDITDYQALITSEHASKPKFRAMVGFVSQGFVDLQNFENSLQGEFDIDSARWTQLDMIGVRVGLDRNLRATTPGMYVQAPPPGTVPLTDVDFQILLRGKIGANQWDGTIAGAFTYLTRMFGDTGSLLFMIDHQDMSITIAVSGTVPDDSIKAALVGGYMQIRPAGVLANFIFPTEPGGPLFGFGIDNEFIGGFGHGVWADIL